MAKSNKEKIQDRLGLMDANEKRLHKEALDEGYKDEVCKKKECGMVFLAFHHFLRCDFGDCPMKSKEPDGATSPSVLHQILGPLKS